MDTLAITGAVKRFGVRTALNGLDLTVRPGEVFALLGPNGAGKTTTINLILGFLRADEGSVRVAGIDSGADPLGARAHVAYIPEQVALYPDMTGVENLRYFTALAGLSLDAPVAARLLNEAGLSDEAQLVLDGALQRLAGTDARRQRLFLADADRHAEALRSWFGPRVLTNIGKPLACEGCPGRLNFSAYDAVPAFRPAVPPLGLGSAALAALYLSAVTAVLALLARRRLKRWPL